MLRITNSEIRTNPTGRILIRLAKAGLSSMVRHMLEHQFGMISSDRGERTPKENEIKHNELKQAIRNFGYGFIKAKGAWKETEEATGLSAFVNESTLFVPNANELILIELSRQFDQEAYVYGQSGYYVIKKVDGAIIQEESVAEHFRQVYPEQEEDLEGYTSIKGRHFQLDRKRPERLRRMREQQLSDEKMASIVQVDQYYFYSLKGNPKWVSHTSGIESNPEVPSNSLLEAWIPLC